MLQYDSFVLKFFRFLKKWDSSIFSFPVGKQYKYTGKYYSCSIILVEVNTTGRVIGPRKADIVSDAYNVCSFFTLLTDSP